MEPEAPCRSPNSFARHGFRRPVMDSVATEVLAGVGVPVLVVPSRAGRPPRARVFWRLTAQARDSTPVVR